MNGRIGGQGEKEGTSSQWLGFCFPLLPQARDQRKKVRMCRRCEEGERERAWPIESRVFSGSKVSLQSLLMQSPWEPFNLVAAAISIRRGHLWTHLHTHTRILSKTHTDNTVFIHAYKVVSASSTQRLQTHWHTLSHSKRLA